MNIKCDGRHRPINIISWNINGLSQDKLNDALLGFFLKKIDIILLSETWESTHDAFSLDGYVYHNYPRKSKHLNSKRESGGLGIFTHHGIQEGILRWSHTDDIIAWIILKKSFFGLENDICPNVSTLVRCVTDMQCYSDDRKEHADA